MSDKNGLNYWESGYDRSSETDPDAAAAADQTGVGKSSPQAMARFQVRERLTQQYGERVATIVSGRIASYVTPGLEGAQLQQSVNQALALAEGSWLEEAIAQDRKERRQELINYVYASQIAPLKGPLSTRDEKVTADEIQNLLLYGDEATGTPAFADAYETWYQERLKSGGDSYSTHYQGIIDFVNGMAPIIGPMANPTLSESARSTIAYNLTQVAQVTTNAAKAQMQQTEQLRLAANAWIADAKATLKTIDDPAGYEELEQRILNIQSDQYLQQRFLALGGTVDARVFVEEQTGVPRTDLMGIRDQGKANQQAAQADSFRTEFDSNIMSYGPDVESAMGAVSADDLLAKAGGNVTLARRLMNDEIKKGQLKIKEDAAKKKDLQTKAQIGVMLENYAKFGVIEKGGPEWNRAEAQAIAEAERTGESPTAALTRLLQPLVEQREALEAGIGTQLKQANAQTAAAGRGVVQEAPGARTALGLPEAVEMGGTQSINLMDTPWFKALDPAAQAAAKGQMEALTGTEASKKSAAGLTPVTNSINAQIAERNSLATRLGDAGILQPAPGTAPAVARPGEGQAEANARVALEKRQHAGGSGDLTMHTLDEAQLKQLGEYDKAQAQPAPAAPVTPSKERRRQIARRV